MSELHAMCQTLAEVCALANGFAVQLEGFSTRIERARDEVRYVAASAATFADQLSGASLECAAAAVTLKQTAQKGADHIANVRC